MNICDTFWVELDLVYSQSESFLQMIGDHVKELFGGMEGDEEMVGDQFARSSPIFCFKQMFIGEDFVLRVGGSANKISMCTSYTMLQHCNVGAGRAPIWRRIMEPNNDSCQSSPSIVTSIIWILGWGGSARRRRRAWRGVRPRRGSSARGSHLKSREGHSLSWAHEPFQSNALLVKRGTCIKKVAKSWQK